MPETSTQRLMQLAEVIKSPEHHAVIAVNPINHAIVTELLDARWSLTNYKVVQSDSISPGAFLVYTDGQYPLYGLDDLTGAMDFVKAAEQYTELHATPFGKKDTPRDQTETLADKVSSVVTDRLRSARRAWGQRDFSLDADDIGDAVGAVVSGLIDFFTDN